MESSPPPSAPGSLRGSVLRPLRPLIVFGAVVLLTASLYWARDLLIPIALATLLTFVLSPVAGALQRRGLGRVVAVLVVVALAFALLAGAAWGLTQQVKSLAVDVPRYTELVQKKVAQWWRHGAGRFVWRVRSSVDAVVGEIEKADRPPGRETAMPVIIRGGDGSLPEQASALLEQLATVGIVALLVVFMLLERVELRNRFIRLVGYGRLTLTTKALDEAAERISRYLLMQSVVNAGMGAAFAGGLHLLGIPYALLWGALVSVLRFVPYIGVWLAMAPPILLSLALFEGWTKMILVLVLFFGLELVVSGAIEPVVYSQHAGLSKVALLVAVVFWTWLWGPVGLVLATPLTVCLVVLAKHVPEMDFVNILMTDEPALDSRVSLYQRLVAQDEDEAADIVDEYAAAHPPEQIYDDLLVPALVAARRDRARGVLSPEDHAVLLGAMEEIVERLASRQPPVPSDGSRVSVLACPARDRTDELAVRMLAAIVDTARFDVEVVSTAVLSSEVVALVETKRPAIVCVSALPPGGLVHVRYLCKRLRARPSDVRVLVGRWGQPAESEENFDVLLSSGADHVSTTLLESRDQIAQLAGLVPARAAASAGSAA